MKTELSCVMRCCAMMVLATAPALWAGQTNIDGPAGSGVFGEDVTVLPNGNFVVADERFDLTSPTVVADVGRVYLYSRTGALISTLTGARADDRVGSSGVTVLTNGNFVVGSPNWDNGAAAPDAGAATWGRASNGFIGGPHVTVSSANSLVSITADTEVSSDGIVALTNGNYVVISSAWDQGTPGGVGAVTWGNGGSGTIGVVSSANSLVGSTAGDGVGFDFVTPLPNGHFVVRSSFWTNPAGPAAAAGAATWCNGNGGTVGPVTAANSTVGSRANDRVGEFVTVLANDNYVVLSEDWDNGSVQNTGAVTWANGNGGTVGVVSASNSLVGSSTDDRIGSSVRALTNGNYVVRAQLWNNPSPAAADAGAATWGNGLGGTVGPVTSSNSLVGSSPGDQVGLSVTALANGHYVVSSQNWTNDGQASAGAATWGNGNGGTVGVITPANSLVGSTANDRVGFNGAVPLTNGNYVVRTPNWDNNGVQNVGAATWGNGNGGTVGEVSASNSLVGSTAEDRVGFDVLALTNGNYLVRSPSWNNGDMVDAGAATWANGTTGITGIVSAANSLVGTSTNDLVSNNIPLALTNGNYVVLSNNWDNNGVSNAGAATWGNGTTGITGPVTPANSLVGIHTDDHVGGGPSGSFVFSTTLPNGNYVISSPFWNNGSIADAGAATWGNGATGITGPVSNANSLVGASNDDHVGESCVALEDGNYVVRSEDWNDVGVANAQAVTLGNGKGGTTGAINNANSVLGTIINPVRDLSFDYDATRAHLIVGRPDSQIVTLFNPGAGSMALTSNLFTVNEATGNVAITLVRSGGSEGPASVKLNVTAGTATPSPNVITAGDYVTPPGNSITVNFSDRETTETETIVILPGNAADEANETFTVSLSNPVGVTLGTPSTATVRIIDAGDASVPAFPVITSPAAGARVGVNAGATTTITGTATDNKGIGSVTVSLNGAPPVPATLTSVTGKSAAWSVALTPRTGANTVLVNAIDTSGASSLSASRTFIVTRPLIVRKLGNGTITAGFSPTSFREVGRLLTVTATAAATPAPGFLFDHWSVNGGAHAVQEIGVSADALLRRTLSFIFKEGLQLTANFAPNPFTNQVAGTFNGAITANPDFPERAPPTMGPEDGTPPGLATEGSFRATVLGTGAFSGTLLLDGLTLNIAGAFDAQGVARFGSNRVPVLSLARPGKPSLHVALQIDATPRTAVISGTVKQVDSDLFAPDAVSDIFAPRASFNGTTEPVPPELLGPDNANARFTTLFSARPPELQSTGITAEKYPQGHGFAMVTLTKAGAVTIAGNLADGTPISASTTLSQQFTWRLFARPYNLKGIFAANVAFSDARPDRDMLANEALWFRPIQNTQHYSNGWPDGVQTDLAGAKYTVTAGSSVIPGLPAPDDEGNADLIFTDGKLLSPFPPKKVTISATDSVTKITDPASFTLTIHRATGRISGTFTHNLDNTKPAFQGMVYQKGPEPGACGFFLTTTPPVKDYTGQGGTVSLVPQ
jgi:major membrane immunogen (membrane-anchored lipoprotein)